MSLKNSNDTIGNRTRDLPVCSVVLNEGGPVLNIGHSIVIIYCLLTFMILIRAANLSDVI